MTWQPERQAWAAGRPARVATLELRAGAAVCLLHSAGRGMVLQVTQAVSKRWTTLPSSAQTVPSSPGLLAAADCTTTQLDALLSASACREGPLLLMLPSLDAVTGLLAAVLVSAVRGGQQVVQGQ